MTEPSFVVTAVALGLALFIIRSGFGLYYMGRQYFGAAVVIAGFALALSDGFATIGEGPLGWIAWITG